MPEQPPTFGRILVRVVLAEPRITPLAVFQRVYAADASLQTVVADAWSHIRPSLDGGVYIPTLYHGDTCIATLDPSPMTVGDLLNLPDQHTLGTVQLLLRCIP